MDTMLIMEKLKKKNPKLAEDPLFAALEDSVISEEMPEGEDHMESMGMEGMMDEGMGKETKSGASPFAHITEGEEPQEEDPYAYLSGEEAPPSEDDQEMGMEEEPSAMPVKKKKARKSSRY